MGSKAVRLVPREPKQYAFCFSCNDQFLDKDEIEVKVDLPSQLADILIDHINSLDDKEEVVLRIKIRKEPNDKK